MVSSGDGGGGTCHNDKPGQRRDKVLKMGSRRVEVREELEGDLAGPATMTSRAGMLGMGEVGMTVGRVRGEGGGRVRLAIVASRVVCLGKWKQKEKRDGSDGEQGVGGYRRGGTCHNDKPGLKCGND